MQSFDEHVT